MYPNAMLITIDIELMQVKLATMPTKTIFTFSLFSRLTSRSTIHEHRPPKIKVNTKKNPTTSNSMFPVANAWRSEAAAAKAT